MINRQTDISRFFITGINYKKTDAAMRSLFAVNEEKYLTILELAPHYGVEECFVVSTCNRTEIYGLAENADQLVTLLCSQTEGESGHFREIAYIKHGASAINHLFKVAAGLDSQILGDYEIVGQLKLAVKTAREHNRINGFTERLANTVFQCSKNIKTNTALSGGTVSVSFAAVQYLKEKVEDIAAKKITLIGTGKFGRNTCRNLVEYLQTSNITLINRTSAKAEQLAKEVGLRSASIDELDVNIQASDIILVATNAPEPIIKKEHLENAGTKTIIDLSIPYNVEASAQQLPNITLINVDELSKLKDETLSKRKAEMPKAKAIIAEHTAEFNEWLHMRRNVPVLKAVKSKLKEIHTSPLYITLSGEETALINADEKIQRVINVMASKMKEQDQHGCHYIQAINDFIATGTN
jgi:glutamyl-tRNA reductase